MKATIKVISSSLQMDNEAVGNIRIAVIVHLYYETTLKEALSYLASVPGYIDIYITTCSEVKKQHIEAICKEIGINIVEIRVVQNRGREISALLIGCKDIWNQYEYICFVHDKATSGNDGSKMIGHSYMYMLWENLLKSGVYIENIVKYMKHNPSIGLLVPAAPYHGNYFGNYGDEWTICYEKTVQLAKMLGIPSDISKEDPPVALGTAFWCRTEALKPLWNADFSYDLFEPEPMPSDNTFSHAIERILPYAAKAADYSTEWIMNNVYASLELSNYHFILNFLVSRMRKQAYFVMYHDLIHHINYLDYTGIRYFAHKYESTYIYGTGYTAYEVTQYFMEQNILFNGYIVSDGHKEVDSFLGKSVLQLSEITPNKNTGIVIAMNYDNTKQVVKELKNRGFSELYFNNIAE